MPDLDRYLAEAGWELANHRGPGYAVRLQVKVDRSTQSSDRVSKTKTSSIFCRCSAAKRLTTLISTT